MKKTLLPFLAFLTVTTSVAHVSANELTSTRQLRRAYLALTLQEPDVERYEALLESSDPDAFIEQEVELLLEGQAFHDNLMDWGHEYIPIPSYPEANPVWRSSKSSHSDFCEVDTLHANAIGIFGHLGDDPAICNDPDIRVEMVVPWWAPSTLVKVIGQAANPDLTFEGQDCSVSTIGLNWVKPIVQGCGCGPHLTFCHRQWPGDRFERGYGAVTRLDGNDHHPNSQKRSLHDEPARFLAYLVTQERDFSDLILSDYTIVDRGLYHMYARQGHHSQVYPERASDVAWINDFTSPDHWREVKFSEMHPHLLDDPNYAFDPRVDAGDPAGLPSSGVLTMLGPMAAWPRPRVRAARWLESLACDEFSPPETPIAFPPYRFDPATQGVCMHCHVRLDAAALSFKRTFDRGGSIAGIGAWKIQNLVSYSGARRRFETSMLPGTVMTPVTEAQIEANTNVRLIDFMPSGQLLLGQESDGTIGPRGFAKVLLASGAFDQCAVRRAYTRFGGRSFDLGVDADELQQHVDTFVGSGRDMKSLIRDIVLTTRDGF
jgi:hypothetical protein